ncbi:hypothetical protein AL486_18890 [Pandoraea apista]|uniref:hypothetical protein n=1 Tax=Pandoraea apista TaxID=93218 RepID=UPI000CE95F57|nr:hypothetical protein [Pandoraea apista]AVF41531.1 hypothetical protein AL486_18890 [Pandoraea apista]
MGDIAEMMLDGTLCEGCGVSLGGVGDGFPRRCRDCRDEPVYELPKKAVKRYCPDCGRSVKPTGLADHMRDVHKATHFTLEVRYAREGGAE